MTVATILLGIVLATLYGAAFHLWRGGNLFRLLIYIPASLAGFLIGHTIGNHLEWKFAVVGTLNAGMGTLGSLVNLFFWHWLIRFEVKRK